MAFRYAIHGLSMCSSWHFDVRFIGISACDSLAFQRAIHGLSVCDSWHFSVQFMAFQRAIHGISVCDSWHFRMRFTSIRKRSVASRHSAEKRNPGLTARPAYHKDVFWIPLFSGITRLLSPNKKSSATNHHDPKAPQYK